MNARPVFLSMLSVLSSGLLIPAGAQNRPFQPTPMRPGDISKQVQGVALFNYPTGATSVQNFLILLQRGDPRYTKVGATKSPGTTSKGRQDNQKQQGASGPLICSVERFDVTAAPPQYATSAFDQDKIWVGSLLQSQGLSVGVGSLKTLNLPASKRSNIRITSTLPVAQGSQTIQPTQSAYNQALARVRQAATQFPLGMQHVRYEMTEESNFEASALKAGLNVSYMLASVSGSFGLKTQTQSHKITAVFVQNAFTMNADLGGNLPGTALLGKTSVKDLEALGGSTVGQTGELSYSNPPVYVDSVTYGRLLMVSMESSYSASEMEAALKASYSTASASLSASHKQVMSNSKFSVYASGGDEARVIDLIRTGKLEAYFQGSTSPTTFVPIAFTTRHLGDNVYSASFRSTEYAVTTCNPNSVKVNMTISYYMEQPDDSKYDDVYGEVSVDGQEVWNTRPQQNFKMYPKQTKVFYSQPLTLNLDEDRLLEVQARLMDEDSGPDDVIGIWKKTLNLRHVAAYMADPKSDGRLTYNYRQRGDDGGSDDALGSLIIEFRRN